MESSIKWGPGPQDFSKVIEGREFPEFTHFNRGKNYLAQFPQKKPVETAPVACTNLGNGKFGEAISGEQHPEWTQTQNQKVECATAKIWDSGNSHVCAPKPALASNCEANLDTAVSTSGQLFGKKPRTSKKITRVLRGFKIPKRFRIACKKRVARETDAGKKYQEITHEILTGDNQGSKGDREVFFETCSKDLVGSLTKKMSVQTVEHQQCFANTKVGDEEEFSQIVDFSQISVKSLEKQADLNPWEKLVQKSKVISIRRKLGRWSRKVRVAAKCRKSTQEFQPDFVQSHDKGEERGQISPLFCAAVSKSDSGVEEQSKTSVLICGSRGVASTSSLCMSESGPESSSETDDNESICTSVDIAEIRVILPSGEIGFPEKVGIFRERKFWNPRFTSAEPITVIERSNETIENSQIVLMSQKFSDSIDHEKIEEVFTNELATDSFAKSKSADKQLAELFKQYREGESDEETPIATAKKFTTMIDDIFRTSCEVPCELANDGVSSPTPCAESSSQTVIDSAETCRSYGGNSEKVQVENDPYSALGDCKEELVNPSFIDVVSKCSQGFLKELKLVQKFFGQTDQAEQVSRSSEDTPDGTERENNEHLETTEVKNLEECGEDDFSSEDAPGALMSEAVETNVEEGVTANVDPQQAKTGGSPEEGVTPTIDSIQGESHETRQEDEQEAQGTSLSWWNPSSWTAAQEPDATLWQALALFESPDWKRIADDFAEGNDLHFIKTERRKLGFLPTLNNVIAQRANIDGSSRYSYLSTRYSTSKKSVSIGEHLNEFFSNEEGSFERPRNIQNPPAKTSLKPTWDSTLPIFSSKKTFIQPSDGRMRAINKEELRDFAERCEKSVAAIQKCWGNDELEDLFRLFQSYCDHSLDAFIRVAEKQILDYTYHLAQMSNAIIITMGSLRGAGEQLAMIVDFIASTEISEAALSEVETKTTRLIKALVKTDGTLLEIEKALKKLRNDEFKYMEAMIDLAQTGVKSRARITKVYGRFIKMNATKEDAHLAHGRSGYGAYYHSSKEFASNAESYETSTFFAFWDDLQEGLKIVRDAHAELEIRTKMIKMNLANLEIIGTKRPVP